jgi:HD-GYP domain-containing protein (c-di-GMP phosphodiesterase class II)
VLRKPGPLEVDEIEEIREHPAMGKNILGDIAYLENALTCVLHHHERFDGKGYPEKIAGEAIPLPGRIISVADAFDAMTSDRPYRKMMNFQSAFAEIEKNAGKQFDPEIVEAFGKLLRSGEIDQVLGAIKTKGTDPGTGSAAGIA